MSFDSPRKPVIIDKLLDDPSVVREIVIAGSPYWTVQRYVKNLSEMQSLSDAAKRGRNDKPMFIAPWFRGDWARDEPLVDGVELFLHNEVLREAAKRCFDAQLIVPQLVYVNLTPPMPRVDPGHTDVPAFVGVDRSQYPVWLLVTMLKSGLFERWYVPSVTGVAWYYHGEGGGFTYWPNGPDQPPVRRPCISNSAVVGDNDHMFHRIEAVGSDDVRVPRGLSLDSELSWNGDSWEVREQGHVLERYAHEAMRISVSWKAQVFADEAALARYRNGEDRLSLQTVVDHFIADLRAKGRDVEVPKDPLRDRSFIDALNAQYRRAPTVFP